MARIDQRDIGKIADFVFNNRNLLFKAVDVDEEAMRTAKELLVRRGWYFQDELPDDLVCIHLLEAYETSKLGKNIYERRIEK